MPNRMNAVAIPTGVTQRLASYLKDKPWEDVNEFIQAIVSAPPVQVVHQAPVQVVHQEPVEKTAGEDVPPGVPPADKKPNGI